MKSFVLGIIPARGGSKGIPDKNIIELGNKPLIAHTIEAASKSELLTDVIVSTDSIEITDIAIRCGASVPFMRPSALATDEARTIDAVKHAIANYEKLFDKTVDVVVLLQPTSPFRTAEDIDKALNLFLSDPNPDSLISCYRADRVHPRIMYRPLNGRRISSYLAGVDVQALRRQDFDKVFVRNGALYIAAKELIFGHDTLVSENPLVYVMPFLKSLNIDDETDLELARLLSIKQKQLDKDKHEYT